MWPIVLNENNFFLMTQALTVDTLKMELAGQQQKALNNFFKGDEKKTLKFLSAVAYCASTTPKLLECTQDSIISSFMKCAEYNLFPSTVSGEVYILPYERSIKDWASWRKVTEAQFQLWYKGIVALLARSGIKIYTDIVKENDVCEITSGMDQNIIHQYPLTSRGKAIGVYAIAVDPEGTKTMKYMSSLEVLEFKKFSKSKDSTFSPWNQSNDPELNMWRKTVIKQIAKNLPLTEEVYQAIAVDNEESSIEDFQKNSLLDRSKRPSEASIENLLKINNTEIWTVIEPSEISSSVTSNNEPLNGSQPDPDVLPEQDSSQSWVQKSLPEKN